MSSSRRKCERVACEHGLGQQPLHLYTYLWTKPEELLDDQCGRFSFVVTDTVLFKHQKLVKWFFTSKQEPGKILCKTKKNLSTAQVLQEFAEPKLSVPGILREEDQVLATYVYMERSSGSGELVMMVEHLDQAALMHLLSDREKPALSMLQRFVPTKSGYNHMLQSIFTPESFTLRKCVNANVLSDTTLSIAQRTVTFEDETYATCPRDVTNKELKHLIEKMNIEISTHLQKIVGKEIVRNVSYFKVGIDNRIYLLWSTMISFEVDNKTSAKYYALSLSNQEKAQRRHADNTAKGSICSTPSLSFNSQIKPCPNCSQLLPRSQVEYIVTYKSVIRYFENSRREESNQESESKIPPLLQKMNGIVPIHRYEKLKRTASYLYQTIQVCHACAQMINVRLKTPLSPRMKRGLQSIEPVAVTTSVPPAYELSAHTLFWRKIEREGKEAPKPVIVRTRPATAATIKPRICFARNHFKNNVGSTKKNQYNQRTFSPLLPELQQCNNPTSRSTGFSSPKKRLQQLALRLKRRYGYPSLRFVLAQANIFPSKPVILLTALEGLGGLELLPTGTEYVLWEDFCKAHGTPFDASAIDIDALDAMLVHGLGAPNLSTNVRHDITSTNSNNNRQAVSAMVPVRPERPKSCVGVRTSARISRIIACTSNQSVNQATKEATYIEPQIKEGDTLQGDGKDSSQPWHVRIDGVEYTIHASAVKKSVDNNDSTLLSLQLSVQPHEESMTTAHIAPMTLTLGTNEILDLMYRSDTTSHNSSLSIDHGCMMESVLRHLHIHDGRLTCSTISSNTSTPPPVALADSELEMELSEEERLVLHETLQW